jgi:hypothetical protein
VAALPPQPTPESAGSDKERRASRTLATGGLADNGVAEFLLILRR